MYGFILGIDDEDKQEAEFERQYNYILERIERGEELSEHELAMDQTSLSMILNVVNPQKGKYFAPNCRICNLKNCNNCPLPIWKKSSLRELLADVVHQTKFNENDNLFKSYD
jgi:hypothetical protein